MQIPPETRLEVVRNVLDDPRAELVSWDLSAVGGGVTGEVGATGGVQRLTGTAMSHGREVPWTVIRKVLRRQQTISAPGIEVPAMDPAGWMYWRREADVYGSGLLDALDGLIAPRCFAIDQTEDAVALWLEDLAGEGPPDWPLMRYGLAARHLGRFGGRHLGGVPVPQLPWLSRGRVTEWLDLGGPGIEAMRTEPRSAFLSAWLPDTIVARIERLWTMRQVLLDALARLPVTLCHHDAGRRNLVARWVNGVERTGAMDWQMLGTGRLGEEPAAMVAVSLQMLDVPIAEVQALERTVLNGYVDGLRDTGWRGNAGVVRLGYAIGASLFMGVGGAGLWYTHMSVDGGALAERVVGRPLEEIVSQWAELQTYLMDLGDEALVSIEHAPV